MPWIDSLWPWRGAAIALLAAVAAALLARPLARPRLAALAAGIGLLAAWWSFFGLLTATPRQLPERLPLLVLALLLFAAAADALAARPRFAWAGGPLAALGALGAGWWMAGAPLHLPDLQRAAPALAGIAALAWLLALRAAPGWPAVLAALALAAALVVAAPPGPAVLLGAALPAAALGAWLGSRMVAARRGAAPPARGRKGAPAAIGRPGLAAALPLAGGLAALAALPVIGRGTPADWAAAAAPLAVLWLGPVLARLLPGRLGAPLGAVLAGGGAIGLAWLLR
jgi:hypothetical protein